MPDDTPQTPVPADPSPSAALSRDRIDLIRRTVARGCSDDELALFLAVCQRVGLDPLTRQIHAVRRWSRAERRETMVIQVGIDGLRAIADRTGCYAPGGPAEFRYGPGGRLIEARVIIRKRTPDGTWHDVVGWARWDEYVQRTRDGEPTSFWATMPHVMLAKCAEAQALRRAFPAHLGGLYVPEELRTAEPVEPTAQASETDDPPHTTAADDASAPTIEAIVEAAAAAGVDADRICARYGVDTLTALTIEQRRDALARLLRRAAKQQMGG